MKKSMRSGVILCIGLLVLSIGLILLKVVPGSARTQQVLPYLCIGLGCGAFGYGAGELLKQRALKNDPGLARKIEIEQKDERNVALANRAKARAFDSMLYLFGALMVSFALMEVKLPAILLLVGAYLLVVGINIYCYFRYQREM